MRHLHGAVESFGARAHESAKDYVAREPDNLASSMSRADFSRTMRLGWIGSGTGRGER